MNKFTFTTLIFVLLFGEQCVAADGSLQRIEVYPTEVNLLSNRSRAQLVVTGQFNNDEVRDLTREAKILSTDNEIASVTNGIVSPHLDGSATLQVVVGTQSAVVPVTVSNQAAPDPIRFKHETLAILTKQGCNSGSCHGSPQGKGGFSLSLFAYAPHLDEEALVRDGFNRRTSVIDPPASLLLKKPTLRVTHVGGKRLRRGELAYQILHDWIYEGANGDSVDALTCTKIEVHPGQQRLLHKPHADQQLSVIAHFSDGSTRDVTSIATYDTSRDEVVQVEPNGLVRGHQRGQAAITVRYLEHLQSVYFTIVEDVEGFVWMDPAENNYVDQHVHAKLRQLQYLPSGLCSDAAFLRRVHLDLTGLLPAVERAKTFFADGSQQKRAALIDELLVCDEHARFWSLKTADLMRVNAQKLKDGRAELFANWIYEACRDNVPVDEFARNVLLASGNTLEHPAANYFQAVGLPEDLAETTSQIFMGSRIGCAKCHNHPFENWTQNDYYRISAVFRRVENKDNIVTLTAMGEMTNPSTGKVMLPWGAPADQVADETTDRRIAFADWLTDADNPFFARVEVNRIWSHLLGRGIVEPIDDFRSSNPPSNVELLDTLAADFVASGYDRRHIIRTICDSRTYQRSVETNAFNETDEQLFSRARARLLTAEQIQDAVALVSGALSHPTTDDDRMKFATQRPLPEQTEFLKAFGQPKRETPCACERASEPTLDQAIQLLNGQQVFAQVNGSVSRFGKLDDETLINALYLAAFSRTPTDFEASFAQRHLTTSDNRDDAVRDLVWALVNTQEFMFQH
ncbi:MAG: hypothetical protein CMJ64_02175 [Planctomycetaceae bacterium]|nr:hypothetical protein [Planctomycetaceae bacterium]